MVYYFTFNTLNGRKEWGDPLFYLCEAEGSGAGLKIRRLFGPRGGRAKSAEQERTADMANGRKAGGGGPQRHAGRASGKAGFSGGNTAAVCFRLAQPVAAELGLSLWDVRFVKEGATWFLRLLIDREDGDVSIDDCVAMSRRMDKLLDEADPIPQSYCLEVSSPGMERELTRPEHFALCEGWPVVVRLIRPLEDGTREVAGVLSGYEGGAVRLVTEDGGERAFSKKETASVRLIDDELWDDDENEGETENE